MVITSVRKVSEAELSHTWNKLSYFQNVASVSVKIEKLQKTPASQRANVRKQATQLRYCLLQAEEYFAAAKAVSMATKPLLLYYGAMSLALAEILFKQSGDSSLDRARATNPHHGLELSLVGNPAKLAALSESGSALRAKPHTVAGVRRGTFELWHRTSREAPICGRETTLENSTSMENINVLAVGTDDRFPLLPSTGVTLLDCFRSLPCLMSPLEQGNVPPSLGRGRMSRVLNIADRSTRTTLVVHPGHPVTTSKVLERLLFHPAAAHLIEIQQARSGCIANWNERWGDEIVDFRFPISHQSGADETLFCADNEWLNEFGLYYVALYILGNYARYYPDQWMSDVEQRSQLAVLVEWFLAEAEKRMPLLALSELNRVWYVAE